MSGESPGPDAQAVIREGRLVYVSPVTDLADYTLPTGTPGALMLAGPRASYYSPRPAASTAIVIPHPAQGLNTDPPPGVPVIQGMQDGSLAVAPLASFGYVGDDAGPINAAALQLQAQGQAGGRISLLPKAYNLQSQVQLGISQILQGAGQQTQLNQNFTGTGIWQHDANNPGGGFGSYETLAGGIRDLVLDGTGAGPGSVGMDIGDCVGYRMANVQIQNFSGAGSVGLYLVNRYFFTERSHFQARLHGNAQNCVLDTVSGQGENSFEFDYFDFILSANATGSGQDGFVIQGGSYISKGFLRLTGNFVTSGHALTSAAVRVQGNDPITGFISHITHSQLLVGVETDNASANAPATIIFGTTSGSNINSITNCTGFLVFDDGWTASNAVAATFGPFGGMIVGDAGLQALNAANPPPGWPS